MVYKFEISEIGKKMNIIIANNLNVKLDGVLKSYCFEKSIINSDNQQSNNNDQNEYIYHLKYIRLKLDSKILFIPLFEILNPSLFDIVNINIEYPVILNVNSFNSGKKVLVSTNFTKDASCIINEKIS